MPVCTMTRFAASRRHLYREESPAKEQTDDTIDKTYSYDHQYFTGKLMSTLMLFSSKSNFRIYLAVHIAVV